MSASDAMSTIRADIRAAGLRATGARISVMQVLRRAGRPLSHSEVSAALAEQPWDKATVYRNLVDLAKAGLLRRAVLADRVWRFDEVGPDDHDSHSHAHFVCVTCGLVECLPERAVTLGSNALPASANPSVEVQLRGECADCGDPATP